MNKYRETLILIVLIIIVGSGTHFLQVRGIIPEGDNLDSPIITQSSLKDSIIKLEQIARISHDYLNGYVSGPEWGTALPEDVMKEEIEQLYIRYDLVREMVEYLYPYKSGLENLLSEFDRGFALAKKGLVNSDQELLKKAHKIFHHLDYEVFEHKWTDDINVVE